MAWLSGPSREEIWRKLAAELGAEYVAGGFWKRDRVEASHEGWTITLDTYFSAAAKCDYTRMRAPFHNRRGFHFTVYRRGMFSDIAKWLGMQDVAVGHEEFDREFIIKGNDQHKLRHLFANPRLRELIAAQKQIHLRIHPAKVAGQTDELCFHVAGVIKDLARLRLLFDLFAETLDTLGAIGAAKDD
ncbi:MAG: DUF3137 domain-containing protein [Planctomycetes bacterium]|nr:DUF3137 domain-containing protein [Planctomycetota bacterium]